MLESIRQRDDRLQAELEHRKVIEEKLQFLAHYDKNTQLLNRHAFEEAIKLEPDTIPHRINEALMYVELSTVDKSVMPMTGAQKLLALDKEYPNNVSINLALGRLSMLRSGDFQKAVKRFENVTTLPNATATDKLESHYMLVECYKQLNQPDKVLANLDACIQLSAYDKALQAEFVRAKKNFENGSQK